MFGKDKESKEFFEVFKTPEKREGANYSIEEFQRKQENPNVIPTPVPERKPEDTDDDRKKDKLGWIMDTKSKDQSQTIDKKLRRLFLNEVILKQETVIFSALGAVFLSLVCFFVGYKIGHKNELEPDVLQKAVAYPKLDEKINTVSQDREIKAVDLSLPQAPITIIKQEQVQEQEQEQVVKWTLQIISYSNTKKHVKRATNLAKAIKDLTGYNAFVAKRGKEIVVCVGKFKFRDSSELKEALKGISELVYEGKKQFASSFPIQIR